MRRQAPLRWLATVVAVVTLGTFALSACGNDDNDNASATTTTALTGTKAACRGVLDADRAAGENDPSGGGDSDQPPTPEQGKAFATALQPHVDQFVTNAPADIKDTATQIKGIVDSAATSGDITHLDPSDATFGPLYTRMETWVHDTCGYQNLDVVAVDYEFQGMPATVKVGATSIRFENHAKDEFHELNVMRVNDDASMSIDEIMAAIHKDANAAEQQIGDQVTFVANTGAPPGQTAATTTSLTKGDYLITCFVPVGGKDGAPPHAQMGMMQKFTVG